MQANEHMASFEKTKAQAVTIAFKENVGTSRGSVCITLICMYGMDIVINMQ